MQIHLKSKAKLPMFRPANGVGIKLKCAAQHGVDPEEILQGTGLQLSELDDPEVFITTYQDLAILRKILERIDYPQFGLFVGLFYDTAILGKWAIAAMHSATVLDAFQLAMRYSEITVTYFQYELIARGDKVVLTVKELMDLGKCRKFMHEHQTRAIYMLCEQILGKPIVLREIGFAFSRPDYASVYEEIFKCPVKFDTDESYAVFDSSYLSMKLPHANPVTCKLYEKECEQILRNLSVLETTKDMVHRELIYEHDTFPKLEYVARKLHMSPRTLRRRLHSEGTTFKGIAEEVRRIKALDLLKSTDHPLERIAEQLGYSDVPNFCHAFKRWTGQTPSSYRATDK